MLLFCACNVYVSKSKFAIVKEHSDYSVPKNVFMICDSCSILSFVTETCGFH